MDGSTSPRRRNSWRTSPGVTAMAHPTQVIDARPVIARPVIAPRRLRGRLPAFTLAECMIASVVLALPVLGVCGALAVSAQQSDIADVNARSLATARQIMEEV